MFNSHATSPLLIRNMSQVAVSTVINLSGAGGNSITDLATTKTIKIILNLTLSQYEKGNEETQTMFCQSVRPYTYTFG